MPNIDTVNVVPYSAGGTDSARPGQLSDVLTKLEARPQLSSADVALLVFFLVDEASHSGGVTAALRERAESLFLKKPLAGRALATFKDEWLSPHCANKTAAELEAAFRALGGGNQQLDITAVQKLFALAATAGEMTPDERAALKRIGANATMTAEAKEAFAAGLVLDLLASFEKLGPAPKLTQQTVDDLIEQTKDLAGQRQVIGALEELYFRAAVPAGSHQRFWEVFKKADDVTALDLEALRYGLVDNSGKLDDEAVRKLLGRIDANGKRSETEREFLAKLPALPLTDAAAALLRDYLPLDELKPLVEARARPLLGDRAAGSLASLVNGELGLEARASLVPALALLETLAQGGKLHLPIAASNANAVLQVLAKALAAGSITDDRPALLEALLGRDRAGAEAWLREAGLSQSNYTDPSVVAQLKKTDIGAAASASVSPDGTKAAVPGERGIYLFDLTTKNVELLPIDCPSAQAAVFSPDGSKIVVCESNKVSLFDVVEKKVTQTVTFPASSSRGTVPVAGVPVFSPDGRKLFLPTSPGGVRVCDSETLATQKVLLPDEPVIRLSLSADGKRALIGRHLVDVESARTLWSGTDHIEAASLSPDGQLVASVDRTRTVSVWSVPDGACGRTIERPQHIASAVEFAPDGKHLLLTGGRQASICDLDTGKQLWAQSSAERADFGGGGRILVCKEGQITVLAASEPYDQALARLAGATVASQRSANAAGVVSRQDAPAASPALERIVQVAIDDLIEAGSASSRDVDSVLQMVDVLVKAGGLCESLAQRLDTLFLRAALDDEGIRMLATRWLGGGSRLTQRDFHEQLAQALAAPALTHAAASRLFALAGAFPGASAALLASPLVPRLDPAWRDELTSQLADGFAAGIRRLAHLQTKVDEALARQWVEDSAAVRSVAPAPAHAAIDEAMQRLLLFGKLAGDAASVLRPALAKAAPLSPLALSMVQRRAAMTDGRVDLAELRVLATAVDADGRRESYEGMILQRLREMRLSPAAQKRLEALLKGPLDPQELSGADGAESAPTGKEDGTGPLVVWAAENRTASGGKLVHVGASTPVEARADGLHTSRVHVSGTTKLTTAEGHQPFPNGGTVTSDAFDQVNALWVCDHLLASLGAAGIDLDKLQMGSTNDGVMRAKANDMEEVNAYYSPEDNELCFGTGEGRFHLAEDADIVMHEGGHYTLDHINPGMPYAGHSGAIHEGFADALAALLTNDPEMSEDFGVHDGGRPDSGGGTRQNVFLRNLDNRKKVSDVSDEPHALGQVYGGYFWAAKTALAKITGDDAAAATAVFAVVAKHGFFYTKSDVGSEDFVVAMLASARAELADKLTEPQLEKLCEALKKEGATRGLIPAGWKEPRRGEAPLVAALNRDLGARGALPAGLTRDLTSSNIAASLSLPSVLGGRNDLRFTPVREIAAGSLQKIVCRADAVNPDSGERLPVADGHVAVVARDGLAVAVGGRGAKLTGTFDWRPLGADPAALLGRVRDWARSWYKQRMNADKTGFARLSLDRLDEALADGKVTTTEVMFGGRRALRVTSKVGEWVVTAKGDVTVTRTLLV